MFILLLFVAIWFFGFLNAVMFGVVYAPYDRYAARTGNKRLEEASWFGRQAAFENAGTLRKAPLCKDMGWGLVAGLFIYRVAWIGLWVSAAAMLVNMAWLVMTSHSAVFSAH